tara:strand:+ start:9254 stop:10687 length:1434 start_codon:yes stop_codon:yes gene_type:complete
MSKNSYPVQSLLFFIISFVLFTLRDLYNPLFIYFLLNINLLFYVTFNLFKIWKKSDYNFFFNPLAISLIINFLFFSGGLTYFFLYENYSPISQVNSEINVNSIYYAESGFLINISSILMVFGYNSKIAFNFNRYILKTFKSFSYIEFKIKPFSIVILILLTYSSKLLLFYNGLFGRIGGHDSALSSILSLSSKLGLLTILLSSYNYFKYGRNKFLFYLCLILEIFFSFLEAARSPIISLFLLLFIVKLYVKPRIKIKSIIYGILVFIIAFTVVTEFKKYVEDGNVSSTNVRTIFSDFFENKLKKSEFDYKDFKINSFGRLNYVSELSSAIQYKHQTGLRKNDPNFLKSIYLIPIKVFFPNSFLGLKNNYFGDWFRYTVLNRGMITQQYNVAFSPIAFLLFSGGYIFVVIGFLFYGILLKSVDNLPQLGFTGFIFFILLGSSIFQFKTNIPSNVVTFFRFLILIPVTFKILRLFKVIK